MHRLPGWAFLVAALIGVSGVAAALVAAWPNESAQKMPDGSTQGSVAERDGGAAPSATTLEGVTLTGDILLTSNRNDLAVCVESLLSSSASSQGGVDETVESDAVSHLLSAWEGIVSRHPSWDLMDREGSSPRITVGCPSSPHLLEPDIEGFDPIERGGRPVTTPSEFRVHLFLIDESVSQSYFDGETRIIDEEDVCSGDVCIETTSGIYLTDAEIRDEAFLAFQLEDAIGLE